MSDRDDNSPLPPDGAVLEVKAYGSIDGPVIGYRVQGMYGVYATREHAVEMWQAHVASSGGRLINAKAAAAFHRNEREYRKAKGLA